VRQRPGRLRDQVRDAREVRVDRPQCRQDGGRRHEHVVLIRGEPQRLHEIVLLRAQFLDRLERPRAEHRLVVGQPEVARPGQEPPHRLPGLPGRLAVGGAELADGLQHPETHARPGVDHLQQRLVDQVLQQVDRVRHQVLRRRRGEAAGKHRQRAQRRLPVRFEQVPRPVDDRVQRVVAARRVPGAATQQGEPVVQAAGDLRHGHDAHARRGQLDRERQPVELAAEFGDHVRRQVHTGPSGPRTLTEQLDGGGEIQFGQRVHRLRGQAERRAAGGEHAQVLGHRHERVDQLGGAADHVLAVVEHQQRWTGTERGDDAGEKTGRPAGTEGRRDLARDVVVARDTGQRDDVDGALFGLATHRIRQPGLAEPARPDDRCHPRGAQQPRDTRQVVGSAEQRVRLVRHAVADRGRLAVEQGAVHGLQCRAGVGPEVVADVAPVAVVPDECGCRAGRGRLAAQQFREQFLVAGPFGEQGGERLDGLRVPAEPGQRDGAGAGQRRAGLQAFGTQGGERVVEGGGTRCEPLAQGEAGVGARERGLVVTRPGVPGRGRRGEPHGRRVDLVLGEREPVAGGRAGDDVGAELGAGPGHDDLYGLRGVVRLLVRPQPVDQAGGAGAGTQVARQYGEEAAQPGAGDLPVAKGHPRQQHQLGGHRTTIVSQNDLHAAE
jgi:hypothetical protein